MKRVSIASTLVFLALVASSCEGAEVTDAPVETAAPTGLLPSFLSELGGGNVTQDEVMKVRASADRGFECGWRIGWQQQIDMARATRAASFRSSAMARATGIGLGTLLLGLVGLFVIATAYPHMRRSARLQAASKPVTEAPNPKAQDWRALAKQLSQGGLRRVAKWLHLEQFDPLRADRWGDALSAAFEAERQLRCALRVLRRLPGHDGELGSQAQQELDTWRSELKLWRLTWEEEPLPPQDMHPEALVPQLTLAMRAARDLRISLTHAETRKESPDWRSWHTDLLVRPKTPHTRGSVGTPPAPFFYRVGWAGLVALGLGLLATAGWFAAGALPLFFAALFSLVGLGAVVTARLKLRQAGSYKLLPGFADRAARWLTTVAAIATTLMVLSSWMSAPSGLDLGDPPPIAMPDPTAMKPPTLFPAAGLRTTTP